MGKSKKIITLLLALTFLFVTNTVVFAATDINLTTVEDSTDEIY